MESRARKLFETTTDYAVTGTAESLAHLQPSHVAGARTASGVTIKALYRNGLCTPAQAVKHHVKPGDHAEAIRHGISPEAVLAVGVELQQVARAEARATGKVIVQAERQAAAIEASKPKTMLVIRKGGSNVVIKSGVVPTAAPTAQQIQVAAALVRVKHAQKAKLDVTRNRRHGVTVTLSDTDKAILLARNAGKVYRSDK